MSDELLVHDHTWVLSPPGACGVLLRPDQRPPPALQPLRPPGLRFPPPVLWDLVGSELCPHLCLHRWLYSGGTLLSSMRCVSS